MTARRPSIVAPVLLIAAGAAALAVAMGPLKLLTLGNWYALWWPVLLVAIGVMWLAEWWADHGTGIRRRHHYVLILALILLGVAAAHARQAARTVRIAYPCVQWRF